MSDTNDETNLPEGQPASPKQPPSSGQGVQSSVDVDKLEAELIKRLERREQSNRDKTRNAFSKRLERLEKLQADGMSKDTALNFMELEDRIPPLPEGQTQPQVPQSKSVGTGDVATSKSTQALTLALGLDANDPEVTEVLRQNEFSTQVDLLVTLADKRKKAQEAPTNPAQQMPVGGGSAINQPDKEVIAAELIRLSNESPAKNFDRIQALNAKLKA